MSFWSLLIFFYLVVAGAGGIALWYFITHALALVVVNPADYHYLFILALMLVGEIMFVIGFLFVALGQFTVNPMRRLIEAMQAFTANGARATINVPRSAPREVKVLVAAFGELAQSVEVIHARDAEISRVKSDFISTAAHQLRTPLTGVRWALEALEHGNLNEEQTALVKNATDKSRELVGIVKTLLDTTAIESGKYKYDFASIDIDALAEAVVKDFSHLAMEKRIALAYVPGKQRGLHARADLERIRWVLNNLVENGVRYTPAGGSVQVTTEVSKDRLYVRVRDTGIGIPVSDQGSIFERFYRAHNAIAKENEGNGLGLYIARQIAVDHGGDLSFAGNTEGPGTTFTLSLLPMS